MKTNLLIKYFKAFVRDYIFIFLTATVFLLINSQKSFSNENTFTINNVEVKGIVDLSFSRDKYINKAFSESFKILMNKILLKNDLNKISDIKLKDIKKLISSFQIVEEVYKKDEYKINIKILYNELKVKKFLGKRNISFTQPDSIFALFYPVFFINSELQNFNESFFYKEWGNIEIKNEIINFILPIEDLEDISEIIKMKNSIENLNIENLVKKYDVSNYVFAFIDQQQKKINIHLKINFNNNKINRNILYKINDINDPLELNLIAKDLKVKIAEIWKKENLINILLPLSISLNFEHKNLQNLDKLRNNLEKIGIINNYVLEEFNINNSLFKIYYYGDPKKLKLELLKLGYLLEDVQGLWQLYLNE